MNTEKKPQHLTIELMQELGAFAPKKPYPTPVEWGGETLPLYVLRLGVGAFHEVASAVHADQRSYVASILSAAVCYDPEGDEPMAFETAYQLVPPLAEKILTEVNRVNGGAK